MKRHSRLFITKFMVFGTLKYVARCTKNLVKKLIGREVAGDEVSAFYVAYIRHLIGVKPLYITCAGWENLYLITPSGVIANGAGIQALATMRALNLAHTFGIVYVHSPFSIVGHADRPMEDWASAWETLFNLGLGEIQKKDCDHETIDFVHNFFYLHSRHGIGSINRMFELTTPILRKKYYSNKSPLKNDILVIGVHVRRGDVNPHVYPDMWTSIASIKTTMQRVQLVLQGFKLKYRFCVFSEGGNEEFSDLALPNTEFYLDADAIWTMQQLVEADILIMAKSSFSYVAAIICDGIALYDPWYLPRLRNWLSIDHNGEFDRHEFEAQLTRFAQTEYDRVSNRCRASYAGP